MHKRPQNGSKNRTGAALIEASLVMAMMCLVLFGALQISRLYAAREILDYASINAARASAVGFNEFMVHKVVRASAIPNAGRMRTPEIGMTADRFLLDSARRPGAIWDEALRAQAPTSPRLIVERQRIPFFLGAEHAGMLMAILDYEDWGSISHSVDHPGRDIVRVRVRQRMLLSLPFSGAFADGGYVALSAGDTGARMARHANLYLE